MLLALLAMVIAGRATRSGEEDLTEVDAENDLMLSAPCNTHNGAQYSCLHSDMTAYDNKARRNFRYQCMWNPNGGPRGAHFGKCFQGPRV